MTRLEQMLDELRAELAAKPAGKWENVSISRTTVVEIVDTLTQLAIVARSIKAP